MLLLLSGPSFLVASSSLSTRSPAGRVEEEGSEVLGLQIVGCGV